MSTIESITLNVVGGVLASLALLVIERAYVSCAARKFKRFFGIRRGYPYHIVYGLYESPPATGFPLPPSKVIRRERGAGKNLRYVTSGAHVTSVSHVVDAVARNTRASPFISSHVDVDDKMDLSFISIGLLTNFKTIDLLDNPSNNFVNCIEEPLRIVAKPDDSILASADKMEGKQDYGIIIKVHPDGDKTRTWICCGGFGTQGTSGAAYYLSHKWKLLRNWAGDLPFACVLKTTGGSDSSTKPIAGFVAKRGLLLRVLSAIRPREWDFKIMELDGGKA